MFLERFRGWCREVAGCVDSPLLLFNVPEVFGDSKIFGADDLKQKNELITSKNPRTYPLIKAG
jgi:hypothetical protein